MPELSPEMEAVRTTLLSRARRCGLRARQSRIGSNQRSKLVGEAQWLSACVRLIDTEKKLRSHLIKEGVLDAGWRTVGGTVAAWAREQERKRKKKEGVRA